MEINKFEVNQQANIADIGTMVSEALFAFSDNNNDSVRDYLLEIHNMIYPNANERIQYQEEIADSSDIDPLEQHDAPTRADADEYLKSAVPAPWLFTSSDTAAGEEPDGARKHFDCVEILKQLPPEDVSAFLMTELM